MKGLGPNPNPTPTDNIRKLERDAAPEADPAAAPACYANGGCRR
jgi:hypothetical protein